MSDVSYLDWPFFDDAHRSLARDLDAWAYATLPDILKQDNDHTDVSGTCRKLVASLGAGGWLKYTVPSSFGGIYPELDVRSLCIIRETLARHSGLADFAFAMQGLGSGAISNYGSDELKHTYLPAVARGEKIAAFALSEPEAGSDVSAMSTTLDQTGSTFTANGEKTWISNGGIADFYTLFARGPGNGGDVSAIVIDADTPGFTVAETINVIAPHPLGRLTFNNCRIPASNIVGEIGKGMRTALGTLDIFRSTVGAAALGFARRALDDATDRALTRKMFGQTLADMPIAQAQFAEMALDVDASALLVYRSAWTKDVKKTRVTREAAMAKLFATDQSQQVIDKALQMFGALGVTKGVKVEELYREIRALRIYEGASDVQKIVIARQHLNNHRNGNNGNA